MEPTPKAEATWNEWIHAQAPNIRAWLTEHLPTIADVPGCWRLSDTDGHYVLLLIEAEYDADGSPKPSGGRPTARLLHVGGPGGRAGWRGVQVHGVPLGSLVKCGCSTERELLEGNRE